MRRFQATPAITVRLDAKLAMVLLLINAIVVTKADR